MRVVLCLLLAEAYFHAPCNFNRENRGEEKRKSLANKIMETRIYAALSKKVKISLFLFSPYVDRLEK